jgi:hypothetical protein
MPKNVYFELEAKWKKLESGKVSRIGSAVHYDGIKCSLDLPWMCTFRL